MTTQDPRRPINKRRKQAQGVPAQQDVFYTTTDALVVDRDGNLWLNLTLPMVTTPGDDFPIKCRSLDLSESAFTIEVDEDAFNSIGTTPIFKQANPDRQLDRHDLRKFVSVSLVNIP